MDESLRRTCQGKLAGYISQQRKFVRSAQTARAQGQAQTADRYAARAEAMQEHAEFWRKKLADMVAS